MPSDPDPILDARFVISDGVARRSFADETIMLNLQTGQYHGLNEVAAVMVEGLAAGNTARQVAADVAGRAGQPVDRVEADLRELIDGLLERKLIEVDAGSR
jgi:hypothetical protein